MTVLQQTSETNKKIVVFFNGFFWPRGTLAISDNFSQKEDEHE
jgi:hypothetical protein